METTPARYLRFVGTATYRVRRSRRGVLDPEAVNAIMAQKSVRKSWTVAAAARSARQVRIDTAAFLREARCAREWEAAKLMRAYAIHSQRLGSSAAGAAMLYGGLGYQPPYPTQWMSGAEMVLRDEARNLAEADLYVLTPQMCDVVIAAAQSLKTEDLLLLDQADLPSPTGLVVLPQPLLVTAVGGDLSDDRAYAWHTPAALRLPGQDGVIESKDGVRMATYQATSGPVQPNSFRAFATYAREQGTPLPALVLDAKRCFPFHAPEGSLDTLPAFRAAARDVGSRLREGAESMGLDESGITGEYVSGDPIDDPDDTFTPRFLYAFWRLCAQRIATVHTAEVNRSARLIAERAGVDPDVRIVQLRHAEAAASAEPTSRQWKHRWVVRMHKVRQWYPSENRHKIIYRGPYIKGPDDKPLLGGETVRALVR